jgi:hypothetical protein
MLRALYLRGQFTEAPGRLRPESATAAGLPGAESVPQFLYEHALIFRVVDGHGDHISIFRPRAPCNSCLFVASIALSARKHRSLGLMPNGVADHVMDVSPAHTSSSYSGDLRVTRSVSDGNHQRELTFAVTARGQATNSGCGTSSSSSIARARRALTWPMSQTQQA